MLEPQPSEKGFDAEMADKIVECDGGGPIAGTKLAGRGTQEAPRDSAKTLGAFSAAEPTKLDWRQGFAMHCCSHLPFVSV